MNIIQLMTYYSLGKWIVDVQQGGKERAEYGKQIIKKLSDRISETLFTEFTLKKSQTVFTIFEQEEYHR